MFTFRLVCTFPLLVHGRVPSEPWTVIIAGGANLFTFCFSEWILGDERSQNFFYFLNFIALGALSWTYQSQMLGHGTLRFPSPRHMLRAVCMCRSWQRGVGLCYRSVGIPKGCASIGSPLCKPCIYVLN